MFGSTKRLDYELEVAAVIGKSSQLGEPVKIEDADDYIFGLVLLNDWSGELVWISSFSTILTLFSARDIQGLEMNPLGPLNGKSFSTQISPWIITLDALTPFKASAPPRNPATKIVEYLQDRQTKPTYAFDLSATVKPSNCPTVSTICRTQFSSLYWTLRDLVAHQTVNGCNLNTGDLLATGTISGETKESHGCLMEVAAKGGLTIQKTDGVSEQRIFFHDGDTVTLTAVAGPGVGFGQCVGKVLPAT